MPWPMPSNRRNWRRPDHRFFQAGRESFLADLQATRTYTDVTAQLAAANTQVAMSQIDLFLALGGGWESGRTQASSTSKP
jgi:outer membrane protein TolC